MQTKDTNVNNIKRVTYKSVADGVFGNCSEIEELTIPETVEVIDRGAFAKCVKLHDVILRCKLKKCGACIFGTTKKLHFHIMPGSEYEWLNNDNKYLREARISGEGKSIDDGMFHHCEHLEKVVIDDGITSIDPGAFDCCYSLRDISIPDSVERIGSMAFAYCIELAEIKLPSSLKIIERSAFMHCTDLEKIVIPENVKEIGENAFLGCALLKEVVLPKGLERIGDNAFSDCKNLRITIPDTVEYKGKRVLGK